ncbi:uncharacterized protein PF3D7_1120000-like [Parasteatoda tepidariorum]|uniref:uncharacterized protein PF3D7_1120000-like n=1 Tax=Parasteatoda tepidariorum TaxID=114398 RepID=UPI00077FBF59|nr:uncharacterized protein LOC107453791 [Parasteatoda tepidariorum]
MTLKQQFDDLSKKVNDLGKIFEIEEMFKDLLSSSSKIGNNLPNLRREIMELKENISFKRSEIRKMKSKLKKEKLKLEKEKKKAHTVQEEVDKLAEVLMNIRNNITSHNVSGDDVLSLFDSVSIPSISSD